MLANFLSSMASITVSRLLSEFGIEMAVVGLGDTDVFVEATEARGYSETSISEMEPEKLTVLDFVGE